MKGVLLNLFVTLFFLNILIAQVGINTDIPDSSAMLDITAADKGILIPRVELQSINDITTISSPTVSLLVYNTTATANIKEGYHYWSGTEWLPLAVGEISDDWRVGGNTGTDGDVDFIGTSDNEEFVIRTNNEPRVKIGIDGNFYINFDTNIDLLRKNYWFVVGNSQTINLGKNGSNSDASETGDFTGFSNLLYARNNSEIRNVYRGIYQRIWGENARTVPKAYGV